jgi:hypothetical protein
MFANFGMQQPCSNKLLTLKYIFFSNISNETITIHLMGREIRYIVHLFGFHYKEYQDARSAKHKKLSYYLNLRVFQLCVVFTAA